MRLWKQLKVFKEHLQNYIKTHLWVELIGSVLLLFLMIVLILQSFLKNQYFNYLVNETWKTEKTMLAASSSKLDSVLKDALFVGGEIAIDGQMKKRVDKVFESKGNQLVREKMTLTGDLNRLSYYSSDIVAITVVSEDGLVLEYGRAWSGAGVSKLWVGDNVQILNRIYSEVMTHLSEPGSEKYQVSTQPSTHPQIADMQMIHIAYPLLGKQTSFKEIDAVVVVSFKINNMIESSSLQGKNYPDNISIYLTEGDDTIFYHENEQYVGVKEEQYLSEKSYKKLDRPLSYFNWVEHVAIDTQNMQSDVDRVYRRGIAVYIILMIICVLLWQWLLRQVLKPINIIRNAMNEIKSGKVNQTIEIKGGNELWQLAEHYNEMVLALREQKAEANRQYEEKTESIKLQSKAEQEALESQINAHFLCNTLNAINYNAMEDGNYEVSNLLKKLSNILQYTFSRKCREVTIGQEIEWVKQYLYLQKYRKMDQFDYEIDYPEEYGEWPCCKLFVQPFVENSIVHGFDKKETGGLIRISVWEEEGRLVVRIWDNGCGMSQEIKRKIEKAFTGNTLSLSTEGNGIAIQNVVTRMRMYFGEHFEVKLETTLGEETCFTFWLPLPDLKKNSSNKE